MDFLKKMDWRIFHGGMIVFYLLGAVAFLIIGDLSDRLTQLLFAAFILLVIRRVIQFVLRWRNEQIE